MPEIDSNNENFKSYKVDTVNCRVQALGLYNFVRANNRDKKTVFASRYSSVDRIGVFHLLVLN